MRATDFQSPADVTMFNDWAARDYYLQRGAKIKPEWIGVEDD